MTRMHVKNVSEQSFNRDYPMLSVQELRLIKKSSSLRRIANKALWLWRNIEGCKSETWYGQGGKVLSDEICYFLIGKLHHIFVYRGI